MIINAKTADFAIAFMKNFECDLNKILPPYIHRKSESVQEGAYYHELRLSPAPAVISGGQSGIDSAALMAASFLGLPAFAIMPKNGRREGCTIEEFQKSTGTVLRKIELATTSYRFRTYANVYFSDVTVIYDFVGKSEGTLATEDACKFFQRPYLLLQETGNRAAETLFAFLKKHRPQVINFAGNSLSKIDGDIQNAAYQNMVAALKKYCFYLKNGDKECAKGIDGKEDAKITFAIPNFTVSKNLFGDFLRKEYQIDLRFSAKLVYDFPSVRVVFARPREIVNLVKNGVDVGFVGEDLCRENNYGGEVLLDTGLIPNQTVLVSKQKEMEKDAKICSQYPALAKHLLQKEGVHPITGSAEAYLALGIFDGCVDTYQTGKTVFQNGLTVNRVLQTSSLVMIGDSRVKNTEFYRRVLAYLQGEENQCGV